MKNPLLKGALRKDEFTDKFYRIYKEAYKYDPETLKIFDRLLWIGGHRPHSKPQHLREEKGKVK